jgi:uncharacterized protein YlbG (UPF0298 family)
MIYTYVFPKEEFDLLTANCELLKAYMKGNDVRRYSQEDFIDALNDGVINLDAHWVKMVRMYPIIYIHADDLKEVGFDSSKVSENDMLKIVDIMERKYLELTYWESLAKTAESMDIPRFSRKYGRNNN